MLQLSAVFTVIIETYRRRKICLVQITISNVWNEKSPLVTTIHFESLTKVSTALLTPPVIADTIRTKKFLSIDDKGYAYPCLIDNDFRGHFRTSQSSKNEGDKIYLPSLIFRYVESC